MANFSQNPVGPVLPASAPTVLTLFRAEGSPLHRATQGSSDIRSTLAWNILLLRLESKHMQNQTDFTAKKPAKIMLVEDDDALANTYLLRLEAEGFNVKRVANGEDALSTALEFKPDLVLLDVMMPKVSGFDVLDIFRNTPETTNLKVIMLTALSQDSDKERAEKLGVDDYLVKSQVVIADVIERIRYHLANWRHQIHSLF